MTTQSHNPFDAALYIIEKLHAAGHRALLAGGCVRDRQLGLEPKDYDIATDATPTQVAKIFPRARHVGATFGVMIVRKYGADIEVATFRSDGAYSDGRHPDEVIFGTEVEDAGRRDFTINGLFLDPAENRIIDHVGGQVDLKDGIIRTIGDPRQRFAEDHLRMLRAVRFAARFGFRIDQGTFDAIRDLAPRLETISAERIWMELELILTAPSRATGWTLLVRTGLRSYLSQSWPVTPAEDKLALQRLQLLLDEPVPASLAMATALCDRDAKRVGTVCRALRLSNRLCKAVTWLVRSLPQARKEADLELADLKLLMAHTDWGELLELLRVDLGARNAGSAPLVRLRQRCEAIPHEDIAPLCLLNGDDLAALGVRPGPKLGELLDTVYRAQLNNRIKTRDQAVALVRNAM
ncbi:MAG: hypothetical protein JSU63_10615 [Phycisphaerales bacterium]|nr:MAG: hypothetical protein JSU63_10615 [Phycisphaerales bacterium]